MIEELIDTNCIKIGKWKIKKMVKYQNIILI